MLKNILDLLPMVHNATSETVLIAQGKYKYPSNLKTLKTALKTIKEK
jgi:hypothetical protein